MEHPHAGAGAANFSNLLKRSAWLYPDQAGLCRGAQSWTWAQTDARVDALAAGLLDMGVAPEDRVLVQARNSNALFESMWAVFRIGRK